MPLRWSSYEEYIEAVHPIMVDKPGMFTELCNESLAQVERSLAVAQTELEAAVERLRRLGLIPKPQLGHEPSRVFFRDGQDAVLQTVHAGELMLLYDKRLALSDCASSFLGEHDLPDQWERYHPGRSVMASCKLLHGAEELLRGFREFEDRDRRFLAEQIDGLPRDLAADFMSARDLFSVGLDEEGLFVAGRGVERVLREIAKRRKLKKKSEKGLRGIEELWFKDLLDALSKVHWGRTGKPLIERDTKALLDFVRELRNRTAHPDEPESVRNPREVVLVMAEHAATLWKRTSGRARLQPVVIE